MIKTNWIKILLTCIVLLATGQVICLADVGDVNMDGEVNNADARAIDEYLVKLEHEQDAELKDEVAADVNQDGSIDRTDYDYISATIAIDNKDKPGDIYKEDGVTTDGMVTIEDVVILTDFVTKRTPIHKISINLINASLDSDNEIGFSDLYHLYRQYFSSGPAKRWNGDVNNDRFFDFKDIELIRQYIDGSQPSSFDIDYANLASAIDEIDPATIDGNDIVYGEYILRNTDYCLGDVDNNGILDYVDLALLMGEFENHTKIAYNSAKDMDQDGLITYSDLIAMVRMLAIKKRVIKGDVNDDGIVNIVDALMLAQYYVGLLELSPLAFCEL